MMDDNALTSAVIAEKTSSILIHFFAIRVLHVVNVFKALQTNAVRTKDIINSKIFVKYAFLKPYSSAKRKASGYSRALYLLTYGS